MTNLEILLHFVRFSIQTRSFDLIEVTKTLYRSNDARAFCDPPETTLTLCLEREDSPHAFEINMPEGAVFAETNLCAVNCHYADGRFYGSGEGDFRLRFVYDLATQTARAILGGRFYETDQWVISNFVRPFFQSFLLSFYGMRNLHGAVVTKGERTVFLCGAGGAGKSTTTLGLMRAGWDLLSDDGPLFAFCGGRACAMSSLDYLHVTDGTLDMFPELAPHVVGERDYRQKFAVSRKRLAHGLGPDAPRPITHFLRLSRRAVDAPALTPILRSAVTQELLNEGSVVFRRLPRDEFHPAFTAYSQFVVDLISDVARGLCGYDLVFANRHLIDLPTLIEALPMPGNAP